MLRSIVSLASRNLRGRLRKDDESSRCCHRSHGHQPVGLRSEIQTLVVTVVLDLLYTQMHQRGSSMLDGSPAS